MSKFIDANMNAGARLVNARSVSNPYWGQFDIGQESGFHQSCEANAHARLVFPAVRLQECAVVKIVQVAVHTSQFPENVQQALLASLRARRINHRFLYEGVKQAQKWLAVHEAHSPARTDPECAKTYESAFAAAAARTPGQHVHVIGLGCGGGQKDARLLKLLKQRDKQLSYTPCDVSVELVLTAYQEAAAVLGPEACFPLVADLMEADDLSSVLARQCLHGTRRMITFFGMLPNFEPHTVLPRLAGLLQPDDCLLLSANLAPGPDYVTGVKRVLSQYDNPRTRDWLMTFLFDLGVERTDGELRFNVEDAPEEEGLKRIAAHFRFQRARQIQVANERFEFCAGEELALFFSYRHTPDRVRELLGGHGIALLEQWITASEEEGVFLCARRPSG